MCLGDLWGLQKGCYEMGEYWIQYFIQMPNSCCARQSGILFFTTGANANCALTVFICYHIVGMWKSLLACQPLCPTWVCHLLMCHCRQSGISVTRVGACTQTGPATAETQPGAWIGLQLLPKTTGPYCPDDSNRHPTGVWMVTCFWFFPPPLEK